MYEGLLRRIAEDVRAGGPCLAALESHMPRSRMLAPLLLLAAIHRMVLEGRLPGAARFYPSKPFRTPRSPLACKRMRSNGPGPYYRDSLRSCGKLACPCGFLKSAQAPA